MSVRVFFAMALLLALTACGSSPEARFYTLGSEMPPAADAGTPAPAGGADLVIGPVTVPDIVDRPQFVLRAGDTRLNIAEQARWAQPLKFEIARVIADDLAARGGRRVAVYPQGAALDTPLRVLIDVQRFESAPGEAVVIEAAWRVLTPESALGHGGHALVREAVAGTDYGDLVAAHRRALAVLAGKISDSLAEASHE